MSSDQDYANLYGQAYVAYRQGNYEEAFTYIYEMSDAFPDDPNVLLLQGHIAVGLEQYVIAQQSYELVLKFTERQDLRDCAEQALEMIQEVLGETIVKSSLLSESIGTSINPINKEKNIVFAYLMWFLCIFYICGIQRIYARRYVSGLLYLFTFGFLGVGQIIDLFLIPKIIKQANQRSANNNSSRSDFNLSASLSKNQDINTRNKKSVVSFQENLSKNEVNDLSFQDPNPAYLDLAILTYLRKNENASFIDLLSNLQCDKPHLRDRLLILQEEEFIKIVNKSDENNTIYKML